MIMWHPPHTSSMALAVTATLDRMLYKYLRVSLFKHGTLACAAT